MEIKTNYPLKSLNTFNLNVDGKYFIEVASSDEIAPAYNFAKDKELPLLVLGGGSNLLFRDDFQGLILKVNIKGIKIIDQSGEYVIVKVGAGEVWDDFVDYCVKNGFGGIENLSIIPGSVGASPVQNIGAYGVEMKDYFKELEYYNFETGEIKTYQNQDCRFDYRSSIFKNTLKGKGVVTSVTFKLLLKPNLKTTYGTIQQQLDKMEVEEFTLKTLREAIIQIRRSKLPEPDEIGNAGSFFKNPIISSERYQAISMKYPDLVAYPQNDGSVKLAAGWLIDQAGWKGYREGDAGVHDKQALVLVNYGNASGSEIFNLSEKIRKSVIDNFGVELEREVNVV